GGTFEKKKCLKPKKNNDYCPVPKTRNLYRVPIMRNEIIPIQDRKKSKDPLLLAGEDDPVKFLFVNNLAAVPGDGSFEKPFASLKEAEKNSEPGDVIYVFAGDKTARNMDQGIVLKKDQILASSGAPLVVGEIAIPAQTPGIAPTITNINVIDNPNEPFITNPGKTRIHDFFVIPPWDYIFGRGYSDVGNVDPHADARDIGFEPVLPDAAPPAGPVIFDNYLEPAPAQIADDWVVVPDGGT
ncbi:MAG TPA: hypothetical protein VMR37_07870, partial [Rhabdochlamydiaceae bacterium]|nr:hypothetical protein [Rhabdochlamydiaceae bacterium]